MAIEIQALSAERSAELLLPIFTGFGMVLTPERIERTRILPELDVRLGAFEDGAVVGACGSFAFAMTVPGGASVDTAGLTVVGVLPTHRRRGILRGLMRRYLDDARRRGQILSGLFASEAGIYGRYGYGIAALGAEVEIDRRRAHFALPAPSSSGASARLRLLDEDQAAAAFPLVWESVRPTTPGMLTRSETWWRTRRLSDPESLRAGRGPLQRMLLELDGRPAGYALYRFTAPVVAWSSAAVIEVAEAVADSPAATRALWRYLLDLDIVTAVRARLLPVDHPLLHLVTEPRCLDLRLGDSLWLRLVDVAAALSRRTYGPGGALVLAVEDEFCPWNTGRYRLADGRAERTEAAPDLTLAADTLGAAYLGAFGFSQLAGAGRVVEHRSGALREADLLFRAERAPWIPEVF